MAQPIITITGRAFPFGMKNCDTDVIISSDWLKTVKRTGLGIAAFEALREDPSHLFNDPIYQGSPILIAGANFGCGSSREHAAWALKDFGIHAIIAPSFSDIFSSNAFKNGILTVILPEDQCAELLDAAKLAELTIDLSEQKVVTATGKVYDFLIDPFRRQLLMNGLDEIDMTMKLADRILNYEATKQIFIPSKNTTQPNS